MRVAATEMRVWLDHLNINEEIAKALAKMVIEVKTEIRFAGGGGADDGDRGDRVRHGASPSLGRHTLT